MYSATKCFVFGIHVPLQLPCFSDGRRVVPLNQNMSTDDVTESVCVPVLYMYV